MPFRCVAGVVRNTVPARHFTVCTAQVDVGNAALQALPFADIVSAMGLCGVMTRREAAEPACRLLSALIAASASHAEMAVSCGAVSLLLRAFRAHADQPAIPTHVCRALSVLAALNGSGGEQRAAVVAAGAVEAVLEFLGRRSAVAAAGTSTTVVAETDSQFSGASPSPDVATLAAFKTLEVCAAGGSDATLADASFAVLVAVGRAWPRSAALFPSVLRLARTCATAAFAASDALDPRLASAGALATSALLDHVNNVEVVQDAVFLLHATVAAARRKPQPGSGIATFCPPAAPLAVLRILTAFASQRPLVASCLEVWQWFADADALDPETQAAAIAPLAALLIAGKDSVDQTAAVAAGLRGLFRDQKEFRVSTADASAAVQALFAILVAQPSAPLSVAVDVCTALDYLAIVSTEEPPDANSTGGGARCPVLSAAAESLAQSGTVPCSAIVSAMRAHPSSEAVAKRGCHVLRAIAAHADGSAFDAVDGATFAAASAALIAHSSSAAVVDDACWLIRWLLRHPASDAATAARAVPGTVHLLEVLLGAPPRVVSEVLRTLLALIVDSEVRAAAAVRAGALPFVLAVLSGPSANPAVSGMPLAAAVTLAAVDLLRCLGISGTEGRAAVVRLGVVPAVLGALSACAADAAVVCAASATIRALCQSSEGKAAALKAGVIPCLVDATLKGPLAAQASVVGSGCAALRHLSLLADARIACLSSGALPLLVATLRVHVASPVAAEPACVLLRTLSQAPEAKMEAARLGALEALVAVLDAHVPAAKAGGAEVAAGSTVEAALGAMRALASHSDNKVPAARAGAIEAVVRALQSPPPPLPAAAASSQQQQQQQQKGPYAGILEVGCNALRTLAFIPENKVLAARAGAIPAVVSILGGAFAGVPAVAEAACAALRTLSANADNQVAAARCGGVDVVIAALKGHLAHANVCEAACGAIRNLAVNNDIEAVAATAGAIPLVIAALDTHASTPAAVEAALGALNSLSGATDNKVAAGAAGAVARVLAALKAYADVPGVVGEAMGALRNLSVDHLNEEAAVDGGALPLAVAALTTHASAAGVVEATLGALANLAFSRDHAARAAACGLVELTVAAMRRHGAAASIAEAGCLALRSMTASDGVKVAAGRAGAVPLIAAALNTHLASASTSEAALGALANCAFEASNRAAAVNEARAITLCLAALKRHGAVASLARAAAGCLWCLVNGDAEARAAAVSLGAVALLEAARTRHEGSRAGENAARALGMLLADTPAAAAASAADPA